MHIFGKKKPAAKPPCHGNGWLQTASDARAWRNRFVRNPWAKIGSLFVPQPLGFAGHYPCADCCCEDCEYCVDSCAPKEFEVIINGVIDSDPPYEPCNCSFWNNKFILTWISSCTWRIITPSMCGSTDSGIMLELFLADKYYLRITVFEDEMGFANFTIINPGIPYDCLGINNLDMPYAGSVANCNFSSATCTLTAL